MGCHASAEVAGVLPGPKRSRPRRVAPETSERWPWKLSWCRSKPSGPSVSVSGPEPAASSASHVSGAKAGEKMEGAVASLESCLLNGRENDLASPGKALIPRNPL